jgi:hypothetical protein
MQEQTFRRIKDGGGAPAIPMLFPFRVMIAVRGFILALSNLVLPINHLRLPG